MALAIVVGLCACATSAPAPEAPPLAPSVPSGPFTAIRGARIFDGYGAIASGNVIFAGDEIVAVGDAAIPEGATIVDGAGKTVLPGLVLVQLQRAPEPAAVTTAIALHAPPGAPLIEAVGGALSAAGAIDVLDARGCRAAVAQVVADGAQMVAIGVEEGAKLDADTLHACVESAHLAGKLAVAQVTTIAGLERAVDAGADGLFLSALDGALDGAIAQRLLARGVFVVVAFGSALDTGRASAMALHEAGVSLLAGDDGSGMPVSVELSTLVRSGLSPLQALQAATSAPARRLQLSRVGELAPGARADLVVVDGDPTSEVAALQHVVAVYAAGRAVKVDVAPPTPPPPEREPPLAPDAGAPH